MTRADAELPKSKFHAVREALRSPIVEDEIGRLRALAVAPHPRTTGVLAERTWRELLGLVDASRSAGPARWGAHRDRHEDAADGLYHVVTYVRGCRRVAAQRLHHEAAAELVHAEVRFPGTLERFVALPLPAAEGPRASSLSADVRGASWGAGATSLAEARRQWAGRAATADDYRRAYEDGCRIARGEA